MSGSKCHLNTLDDIFRARKFIGNCHTNLVWGFINSLLAIVTYLELSFGNIVVSISDAISYVNVWNLVYGLQILLIINAVYHFLKYVKFQSFKPVEVSLTHKKLCRISENENGFLTSPAQKKQNKFRNGFLEGPSFSPCNYQSYFGSPSNSFGSAWNRSFRGPMLDCSLASRSSAYSPMEKDDSFLHLSLNSLRSAYLSSNDSITTPESLKSFLHQKVENEHRLRREQAFEKSLSPKYSLDATMECFPGRFQYQLARSPPQMQPLSTDASRDSVGLQSPSESNIWSKLKVSQERIDLWTERLRKYLGQTILARLSESIEATNKALVSAGHEDVQIGYINLTTLKHVAISKSHSLPQLSALIPFLEASNNQEYLVQRIKELSSGGCISSFKWNSGGEFRGKKWEENLPTDSALLMHFFCCYMDGRLPPHPKHLDGKQFTSQHFFRATDKPNVSELKESAHFHEVSTHPPHYDVISEGKIIHVKKVSLM